MGIATINPTTGETLRTFEELDDMALDRKLGKAAAAFSRWKRTSVSERTQPLAKAVEVLLAERERLARLMVEEMGKPIAAARSEVEKCAWVCRYYAENAERFLADTPVETGDARSFVRNLPLGPVFAVMPWNFPFWQVFRFAAPGLMAGNVGLLKHASNVPQCALAIEEVLLQAGFPEGAFQTLLIGHRKASKVLGDPRVVAATLTGSGPAGSSVAALAGKLLKKTVLELGGSDPFIVMPSTDVEAAAKVAVAARNINAGQSCIAAKRFIVHRTVYARFLEGFLDELSKMKVGDPMSEETTIGPLATQSIRDGVAQQVEDAVQKGARVLTGGTGVGDRGWFYAPTVLTDIPKDARAFSEEMFGPVASIFRVEDCDEAIALANATDLGLGSSVWTEDPFEQERFVNELEAGMTFVNAMVASDPRLPFGGVKRSGYGRELARDGILEFVNRKAISIASTGSGSRSDTE
ncbi:NAD-dependent succinate-semialdehyde dehydrogenase [Vulgatibacter incomptus]|uniref:Succinate-semialdehyde dehydrogenase n=1 Tax=Vulgatibacter incomptus TaxID=1391653 RepID=A0A0K1PGI6_9BACT|nr:NAD-dependent succinate-semialdehyde dehydrogenase [Vulgatibacter incomptus]AKU92622.1 Succinate-semialdehyde dehydrogenase [Vulgatibacter incomptus]